MLTLNISTLSALLPHAAKQDVRFYLCGIYINPTRGHAVATDGHRLLMVKIAQNADMPAFIMDRKQCQDICKAGKGRGAPTTVELTCSADTSKPYVSATVGGNTFSAPAIDGTFPSYDMVIKPELPVELAQYNPAFMLDMEESFQVLTGHTPKNGGISCIVRPHGQLGAAMVYAPGVDALGLVMPVRAEAADDALFIARTFKEAAAK
jgi:DNA polymerase-3 subunit beta